MSDLPINPSSADGEDEMYLWERTGPVDTGVALLERALEPLRFRPRPSMADSSSTRVWTRGRMALFAAAAVVAIGAGIALWTLTPARPISFGESWTIEKPRGAEIAPKSGDSASSVCTVSETAQEGCVLNAQGNTRVAVSAGASVRTIDSGIAQPALGVIEGTVSVEVGALAQPVTIASQDQLVACAPGSSVRFYADAKADSTTASIAKGSASVTIANTPTRAGPGMSLELRSKGIVRVPVRSGADAEFVSRVRELEELLATADDKSVDLKHTYYILDRLSQSATPADAPTLWNLLVRANPEARRALRDLLAKAVTPNPGPPPTPAYEDVLRLESKAIEAWWNAAIGGR